MGFLENIIVTPSHHRVHHAINGEYMDKNYGQIFIVWDKWFGTFQEELASVPPVYGISRPSHTWNPIKINFQHLWLLIKDAWRTENVADKFRIWFQPTGWRPADVEAKYPVFKIDDPYHFERYEPDSSPAVKAFAIVQLVVLFLLTLYFFGNLARIGSPGIFIYGGFIFLMVYAYSELMDGNRYALLWEALKTAAGVGVILFTGDWFAMSTVFAPGVWIIMGYFTVSLGATYYFVRQMREVPQRAS
jgi:hypothetical protein